MAYWLGATGVFLLLFFFFNYFTVIWIHQINKKNCIFSLFFEEIYILSLPIIDKFLWSVVVLTVSPVTQKAEDEFKNRHKAQKSRENT